MFWYLLNRAGLLQEAEKDLKNDQLLKGIYDEKFLPEYGLNFVNLVDRPTIDVTELKKGETQGRCKTSVTNHSDLQAESGLLHREDHVQHISQQPQMRLGLAGGDRRLESFSDAFSNPGPGGDPREELTEVKRAGGES